jgi:site-specific recombinase XerD
MKKRTCSASVQETRFFSKTNEFFEVYLARQVMASIHTIRSYRAGLSVFFDYVTTVKGFTPKNFLFSDCTFNLVLGFLQTMKDTLHYAPGTVNSRLAALRSYLEYVADDNIEVMSVYIAVLKVPTVKVPKEIRPIVKPESLRLLLDAPENTKIGNRDRFVMTLLYDSGIRVGELQSITLGDITARSGNWMILINGKGRKQRTIVLSDKASRHMDAYMKAWHSGNNDPSRPLLYTVIHNNLSPMSTRNIERILKKYGDMMRNEHIDIPETVYPHLLRRTRATDLYQQGVPIEQVSALLGHSMIETTRSYYASPSLEQMRAAIQKGIGPEPDDCKQEWIGSVDEIKKKLGLK